MKQRANIDENTADQRLPSFNRNANDSSFLRLPPEIRNTIYVYILAKRHFVLFQNSR